MFLFFLSFFYVFTLFPNVILKCDLYTHRWCKVSGLIYFPKNTVYRFIVRINFHDYYCIIIHYMVFCKVRQKNEAWIWWHEVKTQ